jgi:hypothetical protein
MKIGAAVKTRILPIYAQGSRGSSIASGAGPGGTA